MILKILANLHLHVSYGAHTVKIHIHSFAITYLVAYGVSVVVGVQPTTGTAVAVLDCDLRPVNHLWGLSLGDHSQSSLRKWMQSVSVPVSDCLWGGEWRVGIISYIKHQNYYFLWCTIHKIFTITLVPKNHQCDHPYFNDSPLESCKRDGLSTGDIYNKVVLLLCDCCSCQGIGITWKLWFLSIDISAVSRVWITILLLLSPLRDREGGGTTKIK